MAIGALPVSLSQVNTEYGSESLATHAGDGGTGTAPIALSEFANTSAEAIVWAGQSANATKTSFGSDVTGTSWYAFDIDGGTRRQYNSGTVNDTLDWCDSHPSTTGSSYEIRTGTISGSGGTLTGSFASNTTYNLGTIRTSLLTLTATIDVANRTIPIIIRDSGGSGGTSYNLTQQVSCESGL